MSEREPHRTTAMEQALNMASHDYVAECRRLRARVAELEAAMKHAVDLIVAQHSPKARFHLEVALKGSEK